MTISACVHGLLLSIYLLSLLVVRAADVPKIAIIGGGIGGASSAYFLRNLLGKDCVLHLYEPKAIGGRMATLKIAGREYESGGSILHPKNVYMSEFVELLGLKRRESSLGVLGIYNGDHYVFKENSSEFITVFKLLWHYGLDVVNLQYFISNLLENFSRIYELQGNQHAFSTVEKILMAMDPSFLNMTKDKTVHQVLKENHFSDRLISELAEAVMLVNYGQSTDIGGFVGSVSLAGAEPGLWSVHGGNKQVPIKLLQVSKVTTMKQEVETITLLANNQYSVTTKKNMSSIYDMVIVAVPLIAGVSNISFRNFPSEIPMDERQYHKTVTTLVSGDLNRTAVGLTESDNINQILSNSQNLIFNSIGYLYPVDYSERETVPNVWKIFSKRPLSDEEMQILFPVKQDVQSVDWLAYPHYVVPCNLSKFILYPGLYHTSSIEWAASAMEMSAIAGRNVALLAYSHWNTDSNVKIDNMDKISDFKDEF